MKTLGLLGGMSWESTLPYYRIVNQTVAERLGGLHSARLVLWSVDFDPLAALQRAGDWDAAGRELADAAGRLRAAGAELLVLCTNTMHRVADRVAEAGVPLLHIVDPTAEAIGAAGLRTVGLLGTRFTMEQDFYRRRLRERHGVESLVPPAADRELVHRVIYEELCRGVVRAASRDAYRRVVDDLVAAGAEGVILGCTEIMLLLRPEDLPLPAFDTTTLHARAAALRALEA